MSRFQLYEKELNKDLTVTKKWALQRKMDSNPDPTEQPTEVFYTCKKECLENKINTVIELLVLSTTCLFTIKL